MVTLLPIVSTAGWVSSMCQVQTKYFACFSSQGPPQWPKDGNITDTVMKTAEGQRLCALPGSPRSK